MTLRLIKEPRDFQIGDLVMLKGLKEGQRFCIIAFKYNDKREKIAVLKALFHQTYIIEKPIKEIDSLLIKGSL